MNYPEITTDDLFDLGFEPLVSENAKSMDYIHPELDIKLWKGMFNPNPESRLWKCGYGKDKIQFESLEQLKEYMASVAAAK